MSGLDSEFDDELKRLLPKDELTLRIEKTWPDLPYWVLKEYTPKQWIWMSEERRQQILNGTSDPGLDYWNFTED